MQYQSLVGNPMTFLVLEVLAKFYYCSLNLSFIFYTVTYFQDDIIFVY